jgi:DNA modification methylase
LSQAVELATLPKEQQNAVAKAIESRGKSFNDVPVREVREIVQEIHAKTSAQAGEGVVRPDSQVPVSRIGDLWVCGNHRVLCDDSIHIGAVEKVLGGGLADMDFMDLPYSVSYSGKTARKLTIQNDDLGPEFYKFLRTACSNALAFTRGSVYVCMSSSELHTLMRAFKDAGGYWSDFLIWAKHHFTLGRSDYQRQYEAILYGWRDGGDHYWCGARDQGDVWYLDRPNANRTHPTMKPVALAERAIRNSSQTHDKILDLFGGSGTTMIACETLEREARLIEIEPKYCDVALERWQKFTGESAILEGDGRSFDQITQERRKDQQEVAVQLDPAA